MTDPINPTIRRFGYPATLVAEHEHWLVLLRPEQPTLASLVLAAKGDATAFAALPPGAHAELATVTAAIEHALGRVVGYEKLNYLMLMMVDPHVHFHVVPRYAGERSAAGVTIIDAGWPKLPALGTAAALDEAARGALLATLRDAWAEGAA